MNNCYIHNTIRNTDMLSVTRQFSAPIVLFIATIMYFLE